MHILLIAFFIALWIFLRILGPAQRRIDRAQRLLNDAQRRLEDIKLPDPPTWTPGGGEPMVANDNRLTMATGQRPKRRA